MMTFSCISESCRNSFQYRLLSQTVLCTALLVSIACSSIVDHPDEHPVFRIEPLRPVEELRKAFRLAEPPAEDGDFLSPDLIEISSLDPSIQLDIRYATRNNFMGSAFYSLPRAYLQRPAAEALLAAHRELRSKGFGILIFDAYRPWYVTKMFWDATPKEYKEFVADPEKGSRHNRGCAVDLTLYDLKTGRPLPMPSGYDEFSERAHVDYTGGTQAARENRRLLRETMEAHGFKVYDPEWWHYDYNAWAEYPILNKSFEELGQGVDLSIQ